MSNQNSHGASVVAAAKPSAVPPLEIHAVEPEDPHAQAATALYYAELKEVMKHDIQLGPEMLDVTEYSEARGGLFLIGLVPPSASAPVPEGTDLPRDAPSDTDRVVAAGGLRPLGDGYAEVKRMWVRDTHRRMGIATQLLAALETRAAAGFGKGPTSGPNHTLRLDSRSKLHGAISLYLARGYRAIPPYNDNQYAQEWFEKRLVPEEHKDSEAG